MNRFTYYLHLRGLGIREEIAASMAKQASKAVRRTCDDDADTEIESFAVWAETVEGHDYWSAIHYNRTWGDVSPKKYIDDVTLPPINLHSIGPAK